MNNFILYCYFSLCYKAGLTRGAGGRGQSNGSDLSSWLSFDEIISSQIINKPYMIMFYYGTLSNCVYTVPTMISVILMVYAYCSHLVILQYGIYCHMIPIIVPLTVLLISLYSTLPLDQISLYKVVFLPISRLYSCISGCLPTHYSFTHLLKGKYYQALGKHIFTLLFGLYTQNFDFLWFDH